MKQTHKHTLTHSLGAALNGAKQLKPKHRPPQERIAVALERIASALEEANYLYRRERDMPHGHLNKF